MEYSKSERGELNVFFTNDEVRQIAAITDYINRLYPKLDEVLLEFSPEYAQEQAAFWKAIADDASRASVDAEGYGLLSYKILDRTPDGLTLSLREGHCPCSSYSTPASTPTADCARSSCAKTYR